MPSCPAFQRTAVVVGQHQTYLANSVGQVRTGGCFLAGYDSPSFITSQKHFKKGKYKFLNSSSVDENCARSIVPDVLFLPHPLPTLLHSALCPGRLISADWTTSPRLPGPPDPGQGGLTGRGEVRRRERLEFYFPRSLPAGLCS